LAGCVIDFPAPLQNQHHTVDWVKRIIWAADASGRGGLMILRDN